jgi:glycosyltransferase involved in cell wall biosynthesis
MSDVFFSVVLPCRNQEDHIAEVVRSYAAPLQATGRSYELVTVPNACTDRTPEIVRALAEGDPRIRVADNPRGGWGLSVLTGLAAARGSVLCYTNSARTDPGHVAAVLDLCVKNAPCLVKVRREKRGAPLREAGSWLYNLEGRLLFRLAARDVNGTPKAFPRELYRELRLFSEGDLLDLELLAKATRRGVRVIELPVEGFRRHGGRSGTNLRTAFGLYAGALRLKKMLADPAA